jgi:predicted DNA-binding ribbon-helix-helix protein
MTLRPKKRSLTLRGHRTSCQCRRSLLDSLLFDCRERDLAINELAALIDETRDIETEGLASAIRDYVLRHYMERAADQSRD